MSLTRRPYRGGDDLEREPLSMVDLLSADVGAECEFDPSLLVAGIDELWGSGMPAVRRMPRPGYQRGLRSRVLGGIVRPTNLVGRAALH